MCVCVQIGNVEYSCFGAIFFDLKPKNEQKVTVKCSSKLIETVAKLK